jgi:hypothetical protein
MRCKSLGSEPLSWTTTPNSEVVVNLTVVNPQNAGFLTAYPCANGAPDTSNVNYSAGQTTSTAAIVRSDAAGKVCVLSSASTDVIVDQFEARPAANGFGVGTPTRVMDTRFTGGRGQDWAVAVGAPNATALFNLTAVNPAQAGYIVVWPCDQAMRVAIATLEVIPGAVVVLELQETLSEVVRDLGAPATPRVEQFAEEFGRHLVVVSGESVDRRSLHPRILGGGAVGDASHASHPDPCVRTREPPGGH